MIHLLYICMTLAVARPTPSGAAAPVTEMTQAALSPDAQGILASFYPVCRDGRGSWDRRACRHLRRNDPKRLLLV